MKVLENMLGRANISHSDLKDIDDPRKVHITRNKLVNFSEDLEKGQQLDTSVLKRAAVGEMVTADEKFKDPYEFKFTAKMIVACNKKPYLKNVTTAIKERWYLLPFTKSFIKGHPERIEGLEGIIIAEEMETVFSWAVDGLKTLMRNKSFTPPERCRLAMEEYLVENSPILCWLEDGGLKKDGSGIRYESKGSELYQDYRLFCKETENFPGKIQDFYAELKKNGYHVETRHNARYVKGLAPENATGESEIDDNVPF
jgi:putative DNA primase/helicase